MNSQPVHTAPLLVTAVTLALALYYVVLPHPAKADTSAQSAELESPFGLQGAIVRVLKPYIARK